MAISIMESLQQSNLLNQQKTKEEMVLEIDFDK